MDQKRGYPLFIIDSSRTHGRGREKDFVACTSRDFPWYGEMTLLTKEELEIDRDWAEKNPSCAYTEDNGAGIRAKLKVVDAPGGLFPDNSNRAEMQSLMRRCLKEWRIRRCTTVVNTEDVTSGAVVRFADVLLEQTRENLRENPADKQAHMVASILTKIIEDYSQQNKQKKE